METERKSGGAIAKRNGIENGTGIDERIVAGCIVGVRVIAV